MSTVVGVIFPLRSEHHLQRIESSNRDDRGYEKSIGEYEAEKKPEVLEEVTIIFACCRRRVDYGLCLLVDGVFVSRRIGKKLRFPVLVHAC